MLIAGMAPHVTILSVVVYLINCETWNQYFVTGTMKGT